MSHVYQERRLRLMNSMGDGVAIIPTAPEHLRNRDTSYPYRHDSYFWYLTGFPEPEALLVLIAGATPKSVLFCRSKHPEKEIWDGFRWGPEAARSQFGVDETYPFEELASKLPELMADQNRLHYSLGYDADWDRHVIQALNAVRAKAREGKRCPAVICDVRESLDEMRLFKDDFELDIMGRAGAISSQAHERAMRITRPGLYEYQLEAEFLHIFRQRGAAAPAYGTIVAGGAHACTLHYVSNDAPLHDGDLVLIDAGCELDGYAADITRTFPVNGRFSPAQKDCYEIVLAAQAAAIEAVRVGNTWDDPHQAALKVLIQGMLDLKLVSGTVDGQLESGDYKRFYMHRTGHWLGMDVHDAGAYKENGQWRALQPGMVLTVEPGLYIRPGDDVPPALHNIGIRIEDNVHVTTNGPALLTHAPKTVADIEAVMVQS